MEPMWRYFPFISISDWTFELCIGQRVERSADRKHNTIAENKSMVFGLNNLSWSERRRQNTTASSPEHGDDDTFKCNRKTFSVVSQKHETATPKWNFAVFHFAGRPILLPGLVQPLLFNARDKVLQVQWKPIVQGVQSDKARCV